MTDDVSIDELREAVEHMYDVKVAYVETVAIDERFHGKTVWTGDVKVFAVEAHPTGATRAYAWSMLTEGAKRRFVAILGVPPITNALEAVRAFVLSTAAPKTN